MTNFPGQEVEPDKVLALILCGGQGTGLFPLTSRRAEPAVPLAGKYRLVDIPISNCINSGINRIYVLTQFNSVSLHRYIAQDYQFDQFADGFVEILAAEQTWADNSWYQGTADAVRKNRIHLQDSDFEYALILSSDQLYRMDFQKLLARHKAARAAVTVAATPVARKNAQELGVMQVDDEGRVIQFVEKPKDAGLLDALRLLPSSCGGLGLSRDEEWFLGSMGIYLFNREALFALLDSGQSDFAKDLIPGALASHRVFSHVFLDYWEDIGTIRSFFEANLKLIAERPQFNFFDPEAPIYSHPGFMPGSKINGAIFDRAIVSEGCIIDNSQITQSVIGIRSRIGPGCRLHRVVMFGGDYYEFESSASSGSGQDVPPIGIGANTRIENAIIDKNARIGRGCVISPSGKPEHVDAASYHIRDGIVIIPKNGVVPDGSVI